MAAPRKTLGFTDGDAYEKQMGQWSRAIGKEFVDWLGLPSGLRWLDAGCGTGAACATILDRCDPRAVVGIDPSEGQIGFAEFRINDDRVQLLVGDAQPMEFEDDSFDAAVAGLVLNLVPDCNKLVSEMTRVVRPSGTVATYVWDLANNGHPMSPLVMAAQEIDPQAPGFGGGGRPVGCDEDLLNIFEEETLTSVSVKPFETLVRYDSFEEYWSVVMRSQGPQGAYVRGLAEDPLDRLQSTLAETLPLAGEHGAVAYTARALAVRGQVP